MRAARSSEAPAPTGRTLGEVLVTGLVRFYLDAPRGVSTLTLQHIYKSLKNS